MHGTLLDLSVLDAAFSRLFGRPSAHQEWFGVLHLWMTDLLTQTYHPFDKLAQAAWRMMVERWPVDTTLTDESMLTKRTHPPANVVGIELSSEEESVILDGLIALAAFPEFLQAWSTYSAWAFGWRLYRTGPKARPKTYCNRLG